MEQKQWKVITEDDNISRHDCIISGIDFGKDIVLYFEDGFHVTKDNANNATGRHKLTGESVVVLHQAQDFKSVKYLEDDTAINLEKTEINEIDFEILDFSFDKKTGQVKISGRAWDEEGNVFSELEAKACGVTYCWNELIEDAWFQF